MKTEGETSKQLSSQLIDMSALSHLSTQQQHELLELLDQYADCLGTSRSNNVC